MSQAAARQDDPIQHTSIFGDLLKMGGSLVAGIVVGAALTAVATAGVALAVGTGGLAAPAEIAIMVAVAGVMEGTGLNEMMDKGISSAVDALVPPVIKGNINSGSTNVYTNNKHAARAAEDVLDLDAVRLGSSERLGPSRVRRARRLCRARARGERQAQPGGGREP